MLQKLLKDPVIQECRLKQDAALVETDSVETSVAQSSKQVFIHLFI